MPLIAADLSIWSHDRLCPVRHMLRKPALAGAIDAALADAASAFMDHRLARVIDAVIAAAHEPGPAVRAFLADHSQPAHLPLRAAARAAAAEVSSARLVAWLGVPALAGIARDALAARGVLRDEAALTSAHLLISRGRAGLAARTIPRMRGRIDATADSASATSNPATTANPQCDSPVARLSESARRGVIRWLRHTRLTADPQWLTDESPLVRLDAVRALAALHPTPATDELLKDFALDTHPAVAATAAAALDRAASPSRRRSLGPFLATLARSPHAAVRAIVRRPKRDWAMSPDRPPSPRASAETDRAIPTMEAANLT